jgi:hypothetical protein
MSSPTIAPFPEQLDEFGLLLGELAPHCDETGRWLLSALKSNVVEMLLGILTVADDR